ncbi:Protein F52A8.6 c [Aphelenchoides avenae]|nr:Protein F52A8.6 c [Aphelenchus avenae]
MPQTQPRAMRIVVAGAARSGKTALLRQLACFEDITEKPYTPTIEDTYRIQTKQSDAGDRPMEILTFHDTAGIPFDYCRSPLSPTGPNMRSASSGSGLAPGLVSTLRRSSLTALGLGLGSGHATVRAKEMAERADDPSRWELRRAYIHIADAFMLVYSVADVDSFHCVQQLKTAVENQIKREGKKSSIVVVGTMIDKPFRQVDTESAQEWAAHECVKLYEVSAKERASLMELVFDVAAQRFRPITRTKFSLSSVKKRKPEKPITSMVSDV